MSYVFVPRKFFKNIFDNLNKILKIGGMGDAHSNWVEDEYPDYNPEPESFVFVKGKQIPLDSVEFLNISEDITGRDLVSFKYEGKEYSSYVTQRYI